MKKISFIEKSLRIFLTSKMQPSVDNKNLLTLLTKISFSFTNKPSKAKILH